MLARNPFHLETFGDFTQVSHGEAALRRFFFQAKSNLSKCNYTNKASSELHTGSRGFFSHVTPTLPPSTSAVPWFTHPRRHSLSKQVSFSLSSAGAGGVTFSTRHNTWPFVKHSHYRQRKRSEPHLCVSKHMPPREELKQKSILSLRG